MKELVFTNSKGNDVTTSIMVAEVFEKDHDKVCRDIKNLDCSQEFNTANFGVISYYDSRNREQTAFEMTKDGFSFLVMGYTGEKAARFKEMFIKEFNRREALLRNEDFILCRANEILANRTKALEMQLQLSKQQLMLVAPKVEYYDDVLQSESLIATNVIAKELGMSAVSLNRILHKLNVIYRSGNTWVLYHRYQDKGYISTKTTTYTDYEGNQHTAIHTYWTEKGREFVHSVIKNCYRQNITGHNQN